MASALIASIAWLVVTAAVWMFRRRAPLVAWAYAVWWLLLFPVLNIFPITTLMNDRYLYLPCILVFAGAAGGLERGLAWLAAKGGTRVIPVLAGGASLAIVMVTLSYSAMAMKYVHVWREPATLWSHALEQSPELPVVQIQWALTLHDQGETAQACAMLEQVAAGRRADEGDRRRIARLLAEWRSVAGAPATAG